VRSIWVNPPAAGGAEGAGGGGAKTGSGAFGAGSWLSAFSSCVNPPCAAGPDGAGGGAAGSLNGKLLAGDGVEDMGLLNGSEPGADCGESAENICVKLPGPEPDPEPDPVPALFGGSDAGNTGDDGAANDGAGTLGAGGALGVPGPAA